MDKKKLGDILIMQKGKKPKEQSAEKKDGYLPYIDIKAFEKGVLSSFANGEKCLPCEDGDLLIVCDGARSGLMGRAKRGYVGSTLAKISAEGVSNDYLGYFLQGKYQQLNTSMKGTGTPHVNPTILKSFELVVPSLKCQQEVVEKIEEQFSELDKGIDELGKAKCRLKIYRQAVLKEAFEEIGKFEKMKNQCSVITSGSRGWAKYYSDRGERFIRITNLTRDTVYVDYSDMKYVDLPQNAEGTRSKLEPKDILISITADLGSIGYTGEDIGSAYINQHIALVRFKNTNQSKFMAYYLKSDKGNKELLKNKRGAGKLGLGLEDIRESRVPVVEDKIASRITQEIEARLSICDQIEKTVDESLKKAENLRQSILKQAFEGRLM